MSQQPTGDEDGEEEPPRTTEDGRTVEDLGVFVDAMRQRLNALEEENEEIHEKLADAEAERDELREENAQLRKKLAEVDQRTDLLRMVKQENAEDTAKRSAVLIQNLVNQAEKKADRDESAKASLTAQEALAALGNTIDRTVVYEDFRRAVDAVGDEDVLWYQQEPRGSAKKSRLCLDLEAGDLPDEVGGYALETGRR